MGEEAAVPILMYHAIGSPPANTPYPELYVSARDFRAHVAWLAAHGYHAVTLRRVYDNWIRGSSLPTRPVVLSFDDGYPGHVDVALPELSARGWPGVLNLHIGNLIPARVRELVRGGWEIDSHTFSHLDLTTLDRRTLRREIAGSRAWIRGVLHVRADFFCYPSGRYDDTVVREIRRAGYLGATTTVYGFATPRDGLWTLRRVRVNGSDGVAGLAKNLRAGP
jgi:peptidoglycan/xylan/chitin deacetylase (PgdA/CDA1 family)